MAAEMWVTSWLCGAPVCRSLPAFCRVSSESAKLFQHTSRLAFSFASVMGAAMILSTVTFASCAVAVASLTAATVRAGTVVAPDLAASDVQSWGTVTNSQAVVASSQMWRKIANVVSLVIKISFIAIEARPHPRPWPSGKIPPPRRRRSLLCRILPDPCPLYWSVSRQRGLLGLRTVPTSDWEQRRREKGGLTVRASSVPASTGGGSDKAAAPGGDLPQTLLLGSLFGLWFLRFFNSH
ncbi:hypothetical protein MUK42_24941 [Musa troglodytarum]|uniref:Uncharacterized protein n=1 Tax=Musa troglodytarum TaxID=320322 RepID=A0A9E7E9T0_9LILI|nr:hypothetical protein MUK42_24941 [Musa troglodytarum]